MKRKVEKFEDLKVWQESLKLAIEIYHTFKYCKDYGLRDQMQRAAVSVPSNISEGYERRYNKEFIRFLNIAKGSNGELRTQLYLAQSLGLLNQDIAESLVDKTYHISAMIYKLIEARRRDF